MPLEPIDIQAMKLMCQHTALAWCLTGKHYGVTVPGITICPVCTRAIAELEALFNG